MDKVKAIFAIFLVGGLCAQGLWAVGDSLEISDRREFEWQLATTLVIVAWSFLPDINSTATTPGEEPSLYDDEMGPNQCAGVSGDAPAVADSEEDSSIVAQVAEAIGGIIGDPSFPPEERERLLGVLIGEGESTSGETNLPSGDVYSSEDEIGPAEYGWLRAVLAPVARNIGTLRIRKINKS